MTRAPAWTMNVLRGTRTPGISVLLAISSLGLSQLSPAGLAAGTDGTLVQDAEGVRHEDPGVVVPVDVDAAHADRDAVAGARGLLLGEVRDDLDGHADPVDDQELVEVAQDHEVGAVLGRRRRHRRLLGARVAEQPGRDRVAEAHPQRGAVQPVTELAHLVVDALRREEFGPGAPARCERVGVRAIEAEEVLDAEVGHREAAAVRHGPEQATGLGALPVAVDERVRLLLVLRVRDERRDLGQDLAGPALRDVVLDRERDEGVDLHRLDLGATEAEVGRDGARLPGAAANHDAGARHALPLLAGDPLGAGDAAQRVDRAVRRPDDRRGKLHREGVAARRIRAQLDRVALLLAEAILGDREIARERVVVGRAAALHDVLAECDRVVDLLDQPVQILLDRLRRLAVVEERHAGDGLPRAVDDGLLVLAIHRGVPAIRAEVEHVRRDARRLGPAGDAARGADKARRLGRARIGAVGRLRLALLAERGDLAEQVGLLRDALLDRRVGVLEAGELGLLLVTERQTVRLGDHRAHAMLDVGLVGLLLLEGAEAVEVLLVQGHAGGARVGRHADHRHRDKPEGSQRERDRPLAVRRRRDLGGVAELRRPHDRVHSRLLSNHGRGSGPLTARSNAAMPAALRCSTSRCVKRGVGPAAASGASVVAPCVSSLAAGSSPWSSSALAEAVSSVALSGAPDAVSVASAAGVSATGCPGSSVWSEPMSSAKMALAMSSGDAERALRPIAAAPRW